MEIITVVHSVRDAEDGMRKADIERIRRKNGKKTWRRTNGNVDYERYDRLYQERTDAGVGDSERTTEV